MRHVLFVAYHFPPMGGVPVRRALRFLRYLPAHGWRASVLTADRPWDPFHPQDPRGLERLPPVERIVRTPARARGEQAAALAFRGVRGLRRLLAASGGSAGIEGGGARRAFYATWAFPDPKEGWARGARSAGLDVFARDPWDVVLATGYPWSAFELAEALGRACERPYVLDFRDAWSENPRGLWSGARHRERERSLVERSAAVVTVSDWLRDAIRRRCGDACETPIETIPNAYDPAERPEADPTLRDPERLVLTFTGTFNDAFPPSPLDQSPYHLIEAVALLPDGARRRLRVRLVGRLPDAYRRFVDERGVQDVFETFGSVSHERALQHQLAADVLWVVVSRGRAPQGGPTAKLLEYAGASRPVLATVPEGESARFVTERKLGWVEPPDRPEAIAARLARLVELWQARQLPEVGPPPDLAADALTGRLAALLDRVA